MLKKEVPLNAVNLFNFVNIIGNVAVGLRQLCGDGDFV
jgi:hypothetical protein